MIVFYIDPGTGSMLISAVIALISVGYFIVKGFIYRQLNIGGDKGDNFDITQKYGLVFYSEGKQYWNVFKPLLEECEIRDIPATFLTSDREDPALTADFENIDIKYIGSGKESYFILNRLIADLVVMTTPGLDVLEIKRSKNVKHYSHITHATSSFAGYKSYATDYFDSVLIGGTGDISVVRELEEIRNLPAKDIEVVGITYLDVLREELKNGDYSYSLFKEKKPTILVSPTWGNHGLLTNFGDDLLYELEKMDEFNVIIRPHPQSFVSDKEIMDYLLSKYPNNDNRVWDREIDGLVSMAHADIMISDFSGIIFDFYSLFKKPIITMNAQYEKRGRDAMDLKEDPWDIMLLNDIGKTIVDVDIKNIENIIVELLSTENTSRKEISTDIINKFQTESAFMSINYIQNKLNAIRVETVESHDYESLATNQLEKEGSFVRFIQPEFLLQLFVVSTLLNFLIYFNKYLTKYKGHTFEFLARIHPLTALTSLILFLLLIVSIRVFCKGDFTYKKKREKFNFKNAVMVLLPMTPIVQYILSNQDILSIGNSITIFLVVFATVFFMIVAVPWILNSVISTGVTASIFTAYLYTITNMASYGRTTSIINIIAILLVVSIVLLFLNVNGFSKISNKIIIIFFVSSLVTSLLGSTSTKSLGEESQLSFNESKINLLTKDLDLVNDSNVYILIYDSYVGKETMDQYGVDNDYQYEYLLDNGFTIYNGVYSIMANSLDSMSLFFNLDSNINSVIDKRKVMSGAGNVFQLFKQIGFETEFINQSNYMSVGHTSLHDTTFPDARDSVSPSKIILKAIIEGEFRFDADFSTVSYDDFLIAKEKSLLNFDKTNKILYTHEDFPGHSQNSGVLRPNETELFEERLIQANNDMVRDINNIRKNDQNAIIVVAGDHGPYLTKNGIDLLGDYDISEIDRLDIQDRIGAFVSIAWPNNYVANYEIITLQDVVPAIISYMFNNDDLYEKLRIDAELQNINVISGVKVKDGIIIGGSFDGDNLFENNLIQKPR